MSRRLDWARDGRDWPNRAASRFVEAGGFTWHVQVAGEGPVLLLVHGTAASTHSFRDLLPRLAARFTVVAPDLPGHGFTDRPPGRGMTLPGMGEGMAALLAGLDLAPVLAAGHSAGAAVLVRMALDRKLAASRLVALNGALLPFRGATGHVAPGLARLLFLNPLAPRAFAFLAGPETVRGLIANMGSRLDARGLALYARLLGDPGHVGGALAMMAHWDLDALERDLGRLGTPLTLVVASRDRAVPPGSADEVRARLPTAEVRRLDGLGHLAHEEQPALVADLIADIFDRARSQG